MWWFIPAIIATVSWGTADLFYKKGSVPDDKYSYLKTVIMVGLIMGLHAVYVIVFQGIDYDPSYMIKYLPVSFFYITSMAVGYAGLRFLELSVSSPVQNSSGAIAGLLTFIFLGQRMSTVQFAAILLITLGVILLGVFEQRLAELERIQKKEMIDRKYKYGALALIFPLFYAILDSIGTFADAWFFDAYSALDESTLEMQANLSYEFTWLLVAVLVFIYVVVIKKQSFKLKDQVDRGAAAIFETIGQFFYVYAISTNAVIVAPMISAYSVVSVILSRIFLKEKLTKGQYMAILAIIVGIIILSIE
ncbi:DMT family transporter [Jeotgalibaca ciconiae]|uniref:DMT family transporter n=1 Tax=Jeotgalibaca ciconiae TaxID=2496265 RepID=A0A3S9H809_9LACT|nr:DMT family transporter [Jeotgalibaca ciconiae]AZP03466.1 DMT family transporter [Jeotgalibaca ciconiae]HJB23255.1 DMT family transporter [Candidatus Jeotgalibaca pullicola]